MKNIEILDINNKPLSFTFDRIINLVGHNNSAKNYIFNYLEKYFSKGKYQDEDIRVYDFKLPYVKVNGDYIGRNFYKLYSISDETDLNNALESAKGSLVNEYAQNLFNSIDVSNYIYEIDDLVTKISIEFKTQSHNIRNLHFQTKNIDKELLLKSFIDIKVVENILPLELMSNYDKLKVFLQILEETMKFDNSLKLVMIKNIENFLSKDDLDDITEIICRLTNTYAINFLIVSSNGGYILSKPENIQGINIITDGIRTLLDLPELTNTINRNYPVNIIFYENEIFDIIKYVANDLFSTEYVLNFSRNDVIIKILNSFYDIKCDNATKNICEVELKYLLL